MSPNTWGAMAEVASCQAVCGFGTSVSLTQNKSRASEDKTPDKLDRSCESI